MLESAGGCACFSAALSVLWECLHPPHPLPCWCLGGARSWNFLPRVVAATCVASRSSSNSSSKTWTVSIALVLRVFILSCSRQPWCWCGGVLLLPFPNWWFVTTSHARFGQYTFWGGWCSRFLGNVSPACAGSTRVLSRSQQYFYYVVVEISTKSPGKFHQDAEYFYGNFPFSFCLVPFLFPSPVVRVVHVFGVFLESLVVFCR